jgi:hypothetical protein
MNAHDCEEFAIYQNLRETVHEEQIEFQEFAREMYHGEERSALWSKLNPDIRRYIEEYYEYRLKRVKSYPRFYETRNTMLRLMPLTNEQSRAVPQYEMRLESTLAEMGVIPKLLVPKYFSMNNFNRPGWFVPNRYDRLILRLPTDPTWYTKMSTTRPRLPKTPPSQDPNADKLANAHKPQIVICVSALKTLFDNSPPVLENIFEIPVTVRVYDDDGHVVVFIDKPLPAKGLTLTEKSEWFHRVSSKSALCHKWTQSSARPELAAAESGSEAAVDMSQGRDSPNS